MVTLATLYNDFKTLIKQNFYDKDEVDDALSDKQDTLVSGTSIKTINNNSLLGSGNITISGSGTVDSSLSTTSTNPVQNQAITNEINSLNNSITNITGFSLVYDGYDHRIRVYSNGILAYFLMQGAFFVNSGGTSSNGSIPSQYAPTVQTTIRTHPASTDGIMLGSDGSITYYATKGTDTSRIVRIAYCYPLKASLP